MIESCEELKKAIQPLNIANFRYSANDCLPVCYRYDSRLLSAVQPERHLRLIGGGRLDVQAPFAITVRPTDSLFLLCSLRGSGQLTFGRSVQPIGGGTIALFHCSAPWQLYSTLLPWSFRLFFAAGPELQNFLPFLDRPYLTTRQDSPAMASAVEELAACPETVSLPALLGVHRLLTNLLTDACLSALPEDREPQEAIPSYLRDFHAYVHDCRNLTFSLADLEALYGVSRYRLCREYSAAFHISPLKDFNQVRIAEAKKLLLNTRLQVQEISSRLGYENINHFIRLFKAQTGLTPGAFRARSVRHKEPEPRS